MERILRVDYRSLYLSYHHWSHYLYWYLSCIWRLSRPTFWRCNKGVSTTASYIWSLLFYCISHTGIKILLDIGSEGSGYIGWSSKREAYDDALLWWNLFLGGEYDTSIRTFGRYETFVCEMKMDKKQNSKMENNFVVLTLNLLTFSELQAFLADSVVQGGLVPCRVTTDTKVYNCSQPPVSQPSSVTHHDIKI